MTDTDKTPQDVPVDTTSNDDPAIQTPKAVKPKGNGSVQEPVVEHEDKRTHNEVGYLNRKLEENRKETETLRERVEMAERKAAIAETLKKYDLADDDIDLLTAKTADEIDAQGEKLRKRYDTVKAGAIDETKKAPALKRYNVDDEKNTKDARFKNAKNFLGIE